MGIAVFGRNPEGDSRLNALHGKVTCQHRGIDEVFNRLKSEKGKADIFHKMQGRQVERWNDFIQSSGRFIQELSMENSAEC
jgi:hypothetical protein